MKSGKSEKDFIVTDEDEAMVTAKLQDFVLPNREEPKVYQPIIFSQDKPNIAEELTPPNPTYIVEENHPLTEKDYFVIEISSKYYDKGIKKVVDFILGFFAVLVMFYFLEYQPLLIFLIYIIGMIMAIWAFKSKRLFIVWGFIFGALFSMFIALMVLAVTTK